MFVGYWFINSDVYFEV